MSNGRGSFHGLNNEQPTPIDLIAITNLVALVEAGIIELGNLVAKYKSQRGKTTQQILDEAQQANDEAKKIIGTLGSS